MYFLWPETKLNQLSIQREKKTQAFARNFTSKNHKNNSLKVFNHVVLNTPSLTVSQNRLGSFQLSLSHLHLTLRSPKKHDHGYDTWPGGLLSAEGINISSYSSSRVRPRVNSVALGHSNTKISEERTGSGLVTR